MIFVANPMLRLMLSLSPHNNTRLELQPASHPINDKRKLYKLEFLDEPRLVPFIIKKGFIFYIKKRDCQ